jgi:putative transcriptional regulator
MEAQDCAPRGASNLAGANFCLSDTWVQGKPGRVRVTYVPAPQVDVRKLRARMGLSQTQFAAKFGFSLDSIQNWEQGHRQPEGPARTLLVVIAKNPKAVEEALGSA